MKIMAYNDYTDTWIPEFEVESKSEIPFYLWQYGALRHESDIVNFKFFVIESTFTIDYDVTFYIKD